MSRADAAKPPAMANFAGPFSRWERAVAGRYLRARRKEAGVALISIIAFVGILLAVATLIIVMSVMNGFRTELLGRILGFNGHLYVDGPVLSSPYRDQAVMRIRAVPEVTQAIPMVETQAMVVGKGQIAGAIVRGIRASDLKTIPIVWNSIKDGPDRQAFGQGEDGGELIFIGARMAESLNLQAGDGVTLVSPSGAATVFGSAPRSKDFTVGGIFQVGMSEYDQSFVYMPLEQAQLFFGRDNAVDVIEVKVKDPDKAPAMSAAVQAAAGSGSRVLDWTQKNQSFFNALQVERSAMRLILMLLVVVAALNIVSGLVMLVKNKGRDIAILRTMGASRGAILRIFVMAGATIGALGTLAGLGIGVLFCLNIDAIQKFVEGVTRTSVFNADVYFLSHIPARVEWSEVAVIVGWSFLISLLATLLPAFWGSRLDPVEALRYE
ncbi:MAG: lipoprotein-releasing transporter permease subunit [Caulobacter sp.]|nr:lipoprotein-releasing transporter permease subunit [Caulobacter sp.]